MSSAIDGFESVESKHPVEETVRRVQSFLAEKGIKLFAMVDHIGEAASVGLKMLPTKLVIFGAPRGGTPIMQAAPSAAIDLPLKALVWEDESGRVFVGWNTPEYLQKRHGFPEELIKNISGIAVLLRKSAE